MMRPEAIEDPSVSDLPPRKAASDRELLSSAISGDLDSLSVLLVRLTPELRRVLAGQIADHWRSVLEPDDILQVTFIEVFGKIGLFQPKSGDATADFQAWVRTIMKHNLLDAIRGLESAKRPDPRRRADANLHGESHVSLIELIAGGTATPSREMAMQEAINAVEHALTKLPPDYARVLTLYDLKGLPVEEVSRELGKSVGAVYMMRARAHERLREVMGDVHRFLTKVP